MSESGQAPLETGGPPTSLAPEAGSEPTWPPAIADLTMLRPIGSGGYGEVWLARTALGTLRAVKIVRRAEFDDDRPYEREFAGIRKFEPISRSHEGFVDLLQVGRNNAGGYFYYVMELADAAEPRPSNQRSVTSGQSKQATADLNTDHRSLITDYSPRTLAAEVKSHGALPLDECLRVARTLTSALAELHRHDLVHRDIKPSNIIFVDGVPKLADIGLVAAANEARSFVGTEGFIPPEGPGTPKADLYSLGIVIYVVSSGKSHRDFPEPPADLASRPDRERWLELQAIVHRACQAEPRGRYADAKGLAADLEQLQNGKSVRHAHTVERRWRLIRRGGALLAAAACLVILLVLASRVRQSPENPQVTKRSTNSVADDQYDLGRGYYRKSADIDAATKHFEAALAADPNFALAEAALATTYCWGGKVPFEYSFPTLPKALVIAKHALERDDKLSDAHLVLAWHAFVREWDWKKATAHFEKAIRYAPADSEPHEWYSAFLSGIGRTNEAIRQMEMAEGLNGQDVAVNQFFGHALFAARRYAEAVHKFEKAAQMPDARDPVDKQLAWARLWNNRTVQAADQWVDAFYGTKDEWVSDLKRVLGEQGQVVFWNKRLEALRSRTKDPLILAEACAMAGRVVEALDLLEQAYHQHHDGFSDCRLKTNPEWDNLRDERRFKDLIKAMKFPE